jgi:prepilin-type N-terminal cleavage/methylation domain-containing protein
MLVFFDKPIKSALPGHSKGFTLLEIMVSLTVGALIMGGVMGAISLSLQYTQRVQKRLLESAVIECAAQQILANPGGFDRGDLVLNDFPGAPRVGVQVAKVELATAGLGENRQGNLYRVLLSFAGQQLEFSIVVPPAESGS